MTSRLLSSPSSREHARERSLMIGALLFWAAIAAVIVLRDPAWRFFYGGKVIDKPPTTSVGWPELDEDLLEELRKPLPAPAPATTLEGLENEFLVAINGYRAAIVVDQPPARPAQQSPQQTPARPQPTALTQPLARAPLTMSDPIRALARARAAGRVAADGAGSEPAPAFKFPEMSVVLALPDRLVRVVEMAQVLRSVPPAGSPIVAETVGGWMNRLEFARILEVPTHLELGVGAVPAAARGGSPSLDAILVEVIVNLEKPLPFVTSASAPLGVTGHRLDAQDVALFIKGPNDPGFKPLAAQWVMDRFTTTLDWNQGPGLYAIRAKRGDRLSDPRPVLVQ